MTTAPTDVVNAPDIVNAKVRLRAEAKKRRAELSPDVRQQASAAIAATELRFLTPPLQAGAIIAGFMPIGEEISPLPLMQKMAAQGFGLALPVMAGKNQPLEFRSYAAGDPLVSAVWGIREPGPDKPVLWPDVVLTALLAFDDEGYRLGYGGGYYDRTIRRLRGLKPAVTIGLAYDEQRVDAVPHLDYDERLDWILTPSGARRIHPRT